MSVTIVDASIAAKWYLRGASESLKEQADDLLLGYIGGKLRFVVPDLFFAEVANVLWKTIRLNRISKSAAMDAITSLCGQNIPAVPSAGLLQSAFVIATTFDRSIYDSMYVALAIESKGEFVTADERLANALRSHFPVKWLGAI